MSYFINPVEEEKCVFLTYEGEMSLVEAMAAQQEVGELLAVKQWSRIVVDVTAVGSAPKALELFALGGELAQSVPRSVRIALVVRPDQARHARLIETVARNGGAFLTFFIDAEMAEAWVRGDPSVQARRLLPGVPAPGRPGAEPTTAMRGNYNA
jgi:hypothetical protein